MKTLHSTEGYVYLRCNSLYGGDYSFDLRLFQLFVIFTQIVSTFQFSKKNCFLCFLSCDKKIHNADFWFEIPSSAINKPWLIIVFLAKKQVWLPWLTFDKYSMWLQEKWCGLHMVFKKGKKFFKDVITDDTDNGLSVVRHEVFSEGSECNESDDDVEAYEDKKILMTMGVRRLLGRQRESFWF